MYFAMLAELIASLLKAQREGDAQARIRFLSRPSLLIADEVGYLPLKSGGANLFFQLVIDSFNVLLHAARPCPTEMSSAHSRIFRFEIAVD